MATIESIHNTKKGSPKRSVLRTVLQGNEIQSKRALPKNRHLFSEQNMSETCCICKRILEESGTNILLRDCNHIEACHGVGYWCQHRLWQSIPLSIVIICNIQWKYDCFLWNFLGKRRKNWCVHLAIYALNTKMKFCKNFLQLIFFFWRRRRFQSTPLEWEMMSSLLFSWFVRLEDDVLMLWAPEEHSLRFDRETRRKCEFKYLQCHVNIWILTNQIATFVSNTHWSQLLLLKNLLYRFN